MNTTEWLTLAAAVGSAAAAFFNLLVARQTKRMVNYSFINILHEKRFSDEMDAAKNDFLGWRGTDGKSVSLKRAKNEISSLPPTFKKYGRYLMSHFKEIMALHKAGIIENGQLQFLMDYKDFDLVVNILHPFEVARCENDQKELADIENTFEFFRSIEKHIPKEGL